MGYQVGNVCYHDKRQAENAYYSLIAPVVVQKPGKVVNRPYPYTGSMTLPGTTEIIAPEYSNGRWTMGGQPLQAKLLVCDPAQNFKDGVEAGWLFFGVMASMYVFVLLKKLLR